MPRTREEVTVKTSKKLRIKQFALISMPGRKGSIVRPFRGTSPEPGGVGATLGGGAMAGFQYAPLRVSWGPAGGGHVVHLWKLPLWEERQRHGGALAARSLTPPPGCSVLVRTPGRPGSRSPNPQPRKRASQGLAAFLANCFGFLIPKRWSHTSRRSVLWPLSWEHL